MKRNRRSYLVAILAVLLASCSTTKHIPDDDHLFIGLKPIQYPDFQEADPHAVTTQEELEAALATEPNGALFGSSYYRTVPYRLWIWNATTDSYGKIKKWLNKSFGKPPVLMSKVNPRLRASVGRSVLHNNGYLHGDVKFEEITLKNQKKMKIAYTVTMDSLFRVDSIAYTKFTPDLKELIDSTADDARIKKGDPFCVSALDGERSRLTSLFRNNGYYYYSPGYASYLADTFGLPYRANLRLQLADSLPEDALKKWYIGTISIKMQKTMRETLNDSVTSRYFKVFYNGKHSPIRPRVILRNMKMRPRQAYSYDNYVESVQKINSSDVFSSTDFLFTPRPGTDTLDLAVTCTFDKPYDFYIETNFNHRTIGRMGPEAKIGLTWRNALRGAEKIDINLHGAYEWQTSGTGSEMNSYQYGADASIEFPRIIAPFVRESFKRTKDGKVKRPRTFFSTPTTLLKGSTDIINRPQYYKMHIVTGELSYRWQTSEQSRHDFSPLTLKYQFMNSHTSNYEEAIENYPYLAVTMSDYFIPKMRYTYTFSSVKGSPHPYRWETTIEESGNATAIFDVLIQGNGWNQKEKTLFKNPYSQYVRLETDYTKTWPIDNKTQILGHLNAGFIYSFGNSEDAPFSEKFYIGGANTIRAFTVRSIGPGAFVPLGGKQWSYLMQNGQIKFVANLEYRRRLFGSLYGAAFLDAGNVWNYKNELNDDETVFRTKNFFKQLATGTGLGLRYDLEFLILRVDWGFGLHVPYDTGKSGYFNIQRFKDMHSLHLAIGYPF